MPRDIFSSQVAIDKGATFDPNCGIYFTGDRKPFQDLKLESSKRCETPLRKAANERQEQTG